MTAIACLPEDMADLPSSDVRFDLYSNSRRGLRGRVGDLVPSRLRRQGLRPSTLAWDFTSFALAAVAADEAVSRERSPDGWTRQIELTVAVTNPDLWNTQRGRLTDALRFLSGDIWTLEFIGHGIVPPSHKKERVRTEELVCLLSGGMDSLVGAIDVVSEGQTPLFVSQIAKGDSDTQKWFAQSISPTSLHLQMNHHARPPRQSERSQRARSLAFISFGVLAASCLAKHRDGGVVELRIPENGFISQNVPLTPMRTGTLSTRTTHPYFLRLLQETFDLVGMRVHLNNPYETSTKGEMLLGCKDQGLLARLVGASTSCGRFSRTGFQHCGRCVPCQVRRGAYLTWGKSDDTKKGYKYCDLGLNDKRHARFDDVRSVAIAIETVRLGGISDLIGGAMNGRLLGDVQPYREVVERGMAELQALHVKFRVP